VSRKSVTRLNRNLDGTCVQAASLSARRGSEGCMNGCGRKSKISRPRKPVTSTPVIVTLWFWGVFSGSWWAKVADAAAKAYLVWRRRPESNRGPRICNPLRFYIILLHKGIATPNDTRLDNLSFDDSNLNSIPVAQLHMGSASRRPVPTPGCRLNNKSPGTPSREAEKGAPGVID